MLLVNVSCTKRIFFIKVHRIFLKIIRGTRSLNRTIQFQSGKNYSPLIHTRKGRNNATSANYTAGFRLLYKASDIIIISVWNTFTVAGSHWSEYHDGKETISIDEVLVEELILATIINEFPPLIKPKFFHCSRQRVIVTYSESVHITVPGTLPIDRIIFLQLILTSPGLFPSLMIFRQ
jgi:hypothetical protein